MAYILCSLFLGLVWWEQCGLWNQIQVQISYQIHLEALNSLSFSFLSLKWDCYLWGLSSTENISGTLPSTQQVLGRWSYSYVKTDISYLLMWFYFKCDIHLHIKKLLLLWKITLKSDAITLNFLLFCGPWYCYSRKESLGKFSSYFISSMLKISISRFIASWQ